MVLLCICSSQAVSSVNEHVIDIAICAKKMSNKLRVALMFEGGWESGGTKHISHPFLEALESSLITGEIQSLRATSTRGMQYQGM